ILFFSSRRRHTRSKRDWSSDVCSSDLNIVQEHYEVHYIVLRASKEETMKRAIERSKLDRETNIELVETMWKQFSNLGIYELNVIDTTTHSIKDTVSAVQEKIASKRTTLVEESELTHVAAPDNPTKEFENRQEQVRFLSQEWKSTRLNSSHVSISYAVFCLKKKKTQEHTDT